VAALGGAIAVWRRERALGWMIVPAPVLFLAFMGLQGRYFGRWLMPSLPFMCLLAALFASTVAGAFAARVRPVARPGRAARAGATIAAGLLAQGLVYSLHTGLVLSRADTRAVTRRWMLAHIPAGAKVVVEPIAPDNWVAERPGAAGCPGRRWCKYASLLLRVTPSGSVAPSATGIVTLEDYERTLAPSLVRYYERHGYCWVVSGSTQSGRAFADPRSVPRAIAYYRALARQGEVVFVASPYGSRRNAVPFNFDWSFDYYPLAYHRPGPQMTVYRLHGGRCA
jgi:hypothetical protein